MRMKRGAGVIAAAMLCLLALPAAAEETGLIIDGQAGRVTGHFTGPVVETLDVDMPVPREAPEQVACKVKEIRITQDALEKALSGLIYDDHAHNFNIDPGSTSNYVYEDAANPAGYEYSGEPFISDRPDKAEEIAQAQQVAATLLDRLGIAYVEPFYFVGRGEDFFSKRYPRSQEEEEHWAISGTREAWEADELTLIVAQYDLGGLPQGEWFIANEKTKGGYDYGGAAYIVVDDAGKIVFAKIFNPRQYVESLNDQPQVISWQEALEAAIAYRTQTPFPAKSIRNWTGTLVSMELCVFVDQNGRTYPVWKLIEDCFYDYTDFRGNPTTCGGSSWLYIDAVTGMVKP